MSVEERPRLLFSLSADRSRGAPSARRNGALWRLTEDRRVCDALSAGLPPGGEVRENTGPTPSGDLLLIVVEGDGRLEGGDERLALAAGSVAWLPRRVRCGLRAGPRGMVYVIVRARRPEVGAGGPDAREAGEAACALARVCPHCGGVRADPGAPYCAWCGERVSR